MPKLTLQQLEAHLLSAANVLRGRTAGQDYKTYILSLMFFKRLSDQWDNEPEERVKQLEKDRGSPFNPKQRGKMLAEAAVHRFTIPDGCHWSDVIGAGKDHGAVLTRAMRAIAGANAELKGVFTVDWNLPAPDGSGAKLIANEVVVELLNRLNRVPLSNEDASADILGRAYEYLIKYFADDAGAKAGEFFTPPEVVDCLVRILEPAPGDTVYDPTCGSGGMLVHSADYLKERKHDIAELRYFGQELNWSTYAIARINCILHGMEADIRGGRSTITDPAFRDPANESAVRRFDIAIANFPFSDSTWWLAPEEQGSDKAAKAKKNLKEYKDPFGRFVHNPPASYGDFAYIQHIVASLTDRGKAGVVCPQGVLFRGQPATEEEEADAEADDKPKARKRKADDEHLIRKSLIDRRFVDAVIALPLNIFYGAGVPACLLIIDKARPKKRRDKLLLVYAARHFRELSNKNQLRPQDVMRVLVHYHAYGDATKAAKLVAEHGARLKSQIEFDRDEEVGRIQAEFEERFPKQNPSPTPPLRREGLNPADSPAPPPFLGEGVGGRGSSSSKPNKARAAAEAEQNERIAEATKRAGEEREAIDAVGAELVALYANPAELAKHARVVDVNEVIENEYNLNIPRYVDTFEPEAPIDVAAALKELDAAEQARADAETRLRELLKGVGYGA